LTKTGFNRKFPPKRFCQIDPRKLIVVGGFPLDQPATDTTEVLDLDSMAWTFGPTLPVPLAGSQIVEHYKGGVVLIGGMDFDYLGPILRSSISAESFFG
jgi:hypothetical protein